MIASVNKTPEDEIDNDTSFHFCKFLKQNVSKTEIGVFKKM